MGRKGLHSGTVSRPLSCGLNHRRLARAPRGGTSCAVAGRTSGVNRKFHREPSPGFLGGTGWLLRTLTWAKGTGRTAVRRGVGAFRGCLHLPSLSSCVVAAQGFSAAVDPRVARRRHIVSRQAAGRGCDPGPPGSPDLRAALPPGLGGQRLRERTPAARSGSGLGVLGAGEVRLQPGSPDLRLVGAGGTQGSCGAHFCVRICREEEVQEAALRG